MAEEDVRPHLGRGGGVREPAVGGPRADLQVVPQRLRRLRARVAVEEGHVPRHEPHGRPVRPQPRARGREVADREDVGAAPDERLVRLVEEGHEAFGGEEGVDVVEAARADQGRGAEEEGAGGEEPSERGHGGGESPATHQQDTADAERSVGGMRRRESNGRC